MVLKDKMIPKTTVSRMILLPALLNLKTAF